MNNKDNIKVGLLYFYIHLTVEILCFYTLSKIVGNSIVLWLVPLIYDFLAFVPQAIFGILADKYKKIPYCLLGIFMMIIGLIIFELFDMKYLSIIIIALGNALVHVSGAEATLKVGNGQMRPAAFFVGGGSFGVIIGKLLAMSKINYILIILIMLSSIPVVILNNIYVDEIKAKKINYNYHNSKINPLLIIFLATFVVIVRGYMGYGIPTSWNKTTLQTILLYFSMGIGKMLGGILIDKIGIKKTIIISTIGALPFLIFGNNLMIISIFGIMLFSMTMAVTLGILVSVLKNNYGLAFGYTTVGLFLGTLPIFFIKIENSYLNIILLLILTIISMLCLLLITRSDNNENNS